MKKKKNLSNLESACKISYCLMRLNIISDIYFNKSSETSYHHRHKYLMNKYKECSKYVSFHLSKTTIATVGIKQLYYVTTVLNTDH